MQLLALAAWGAKMRRMGCVVLPALGQFWSENGRRPHACIKNQARSMRSARSGIPTKPTHFIITSVCTHTQTLSIRPACDALFGARGRKKMIFCSKEKRPLNEPTNDTPCEIVCWATAVTSLGPHPLLIDSRPCNSWAVCLWVLGASEKLQCRAVFCAFCLLIMSPFNFSSANCKIARHVFTPRILDTVTLSLCARYATYWFAH